MNSLLTDSKVQLSLDLSEKLQSQPAEDVVIDASTLGNICELSPFRCRIINLKAMENTHKKWN
jgi:hypothetical protein